MQICQNPISCCEARCEYACMSRLLGQPMSQCATAYAAARSVHGQVHSSQGPTSSLDQRVARLEAALAEPQQPAPQH